MFTVFAIQSTFMTILTLAAVRGAGVGVRRRADPPSRDAFVAADKLTKPAWLIILGIAAGRAHADLEPVSFLNLIGAVAAIVYIVDARPALQALTRR